MRRPLILMAVMTATVLAVSGVAYALTFTCDGQGDPAPGGECTGTNESDVIIGTVQRDSISALDGRDDVTARGGDDTVNGGGGKDDILGGGGGDLLSGGKAGDDIDGGAGTTDNASAPLISFTCTIFNPEAGIDASVTGTQLLSGGGGNDLLTGGRDNDLLLGGSGTNDLSDNDGGGDCFILEGDENERVSGGEGFDVIFANDDNADDIFCGPGRDAVQADAEDRVAANCEDVIEASPLRAAGATPEAEVTINGAPVEFGS